MPLHKEQKTITYLEIFKYLPLVVDTRANGNSAVLIDEVIGDEYLSLATVYSSGISKMFVKNRTLRFTPINGATFTIQEGT